MGRAAARTVVTPGELADDNELLGRLADLLADRVVERLMPWLVPGQGRPEGLISAREVARMTGMTRRWVYDHAGDLGACRWALDQRPGLASIPLECASTSTRASPIPHRYRCPCRTTPSHAAADNQRRPMP